MSEVPLSCPAQLDEQSGRALLKSLRKKGLQRGETLVLDFSGTSSLDSLGAASLIQIADFTRKHHAGIRWEGQQGAVADFVDILEPGIVEPEALPPRHEGFFERLGDQCIGFFKELSEFGALCVDAFYWTLLAPLEGKGFRWGVYVDQLYEMGCRAVGIVCLMNLLLGLIIAMLSSAQVEVYGINLYVADAIMIGFARELAAIMTATVVSARTGAAIAAEIATMKVQEEIDALKGMGLNVNQFIVAPKLLALLTVMPCLVILGMLSGIVGGTLWGVFALGFTPAIWLNETMMAARSGDIFQGILKTLFFAVTIVLIGCHNGFRVTGGSRGVGLMTTRAVVMDIFMLITIDIVFATLFYYVLR
jgi:phospholipid/cholesterol/gamma-HCH transport system permease protein